MFAKFEFFYSLGSVLQCRKNGVGCWPLGNNKQCCSGFCYEFGSTDTGFWGPGYIQRKKEISKQPNNLRK